MPFRAFPRTNLVEESERASCKRPRNYYADSAKSVKMPRQTESSSTATPLRAQRLPFAPIDMNSLRSRTLKPKPGRMLDLGNLVRKDQVDSEMRVDTVVLELCFESDKVMRQFKHSLEDVAPGRPRVQDVQRRQCPELEPEGLRLNQYK